MNKLKMYGLTAGLLGLIMLMSIFGPSALSRYADAGILGNVRTEPENAAAGYRFRLSVAERLYILAAALDSRTLPQSDFAASLRERLPSVNQGDELLPYAYVPNSRGTDNGEIAQEDVLAAFWGEVEALQELGVIPKADFEEDGYGARLYSALDALEPQRNLTIWQIEFTPQRSARSKNSLMDAYMDGESGKIYGFSVRTGTVWKELNPDEIVRSWCGYLGLNPPERYDGDNELMESTEYFQKYIIEGDGEEKTVVTLGFYEGINELFLKISVLMQL